MPGWAREFELEVSGLSSGLQVVASGMEKCKGKEVAVVSEWLTSNISNTRDSVSSGHPNTEKSVENNITG